MIPTGWYAHSCKQGGVDGQVIKEGHAGCICVNTVKGESMGNDCSSGSCETRSSETSGCDSSRDCCKACNTACGGDPIQCASAMWSSAFCTAMHEVQVELLKAKIHKAWGPKMDKAADAVVESMGTQWQSMLAQSKAKCDFKSKLRALWSEQK